LPWDVCTRTKIDFDEAVERLMTNGWRPEIDVDRAVKRLVWNGLRRDVAKKVINQQKRKVR